MQNIAPTNLKYNLQKKSGGTFIKNQVNNKYIRCTFHPVAVFYKESKRERQLVEKG